ncbi:MAG: NAD(P)/FAD-dependent oxidoreductase, partial [Acidobacteria bacterium]|nr:NAD(P)/FAD-dependent oxidoreductase [Acidobacteriota bacterium]
MATASERDVVVVGAGPAGTALASHLTRLGHDILVLERSPGPRQKICGEYLSSDCIPLLDRLGVLPDLDRVRPRRLRGMRIHTPAGVVVTGDFPDVPAPEPDTEGTGTGLREWPGGIAIPRPVLDGILASNAARSGAEVRWGVRVTRLLHGRAGVTGIVTRDPEGEREVRCRLVVGADGRHSVVARDLGLRRPHPWLRRTGFIVRCGTAPAESEYGEVFLARDSYCILNPI